MRRTHRLPRRLIRWTGFVVSFCLITSSVVTPAIASGAKSRIRVAQGQQPFVSQGERQPAPKDKGKRVTARPPEPDRPPILLPDLDEVRQRKQDKTKAPRPIESTTRSRHKPVESRHGRKVGDPLPAKQKASAVNLGDGSERVTAAGADTRGLVGTARSHQARTTRSLPTGMHTIASTTTLLSFISSLRGVANHTAFDFLRYPISHSESYSRSVSLHSSETTSRVGDSLITDGFNLLTAVIPQSGSSKIVYASNRDGSMQIYVMNGDGSAVTRLTYSGANDDYPRWSSNGTKILFQSDRDNPSTGYMDIYVMNADGAGVVRLTSDPNDDSMASWSPDGSKIVFQSMRNGVNYQVYSMNADGSNQVCLTNTSSNDGEPSWSPDGSRIAFASDRDHAGYDSVYVMNANGSNQQRLTFSASTVDDTQPAWSPNGGKIAFVSTRDSTTETWQETDDDGNVINRSKVHINKEVYVMNSDGSAQTRLTNELANDDAPSWSPDGTKIVFRSDRERDCCDPSAQVWTMYADGTGQADISNNQIGDYTASWAFGSVNQLPIANPGGAYSGIIAQNVPFNGGSSYDPDGSVVSYSWNFGDGGTGSGAAPTHAYTAAGSYTVTLTVTDNLGGHGSASTAISISSSSSDQFAQTFLQWGLGRSPNSNESTYWTDILRSAYSQGQTSMLLATTEFGMTVFESAEYAGRGRGDHDYVYDLYKSYLMREPDQDGWDYWTGQASPQHLGREAVRNAFEDSIEFHNIVANLAASGSPSSAVASLSTARVDPFNQSGDQLQARDCEWSIPLVSLPGRAGLDLGLSLSYSSLVWTQSGPYIYFDQDNESISPGFTIGFPTVQWRSFDAQTARNVYLLTAAGRRVELRQVGASNVYEAGDSSYLQLIDYGGSLLLRSTDGTQISFSPFLTSWGVTQIKDRNGNLINVQNDWRGDIQNVTDTLGRIITFNYDGNANLISISQSWAGQPQPHTWASFGWGTIGMQPSFSSEVVGTNSGEIIPVLTQVGLDDGSRYNFEYTDRGQVNVIRRYTSDNVQRSYVAYNYESPADDCPRITASRLWAENWSDVYGVPHEVVTSFSDPGDGSRQMVTPDGTIYKEFFGGSWQHGLVTQSEVWSGGARQKWTTTNYTQDNTSVSYQTNPRVIETIIDDAAGNHRRATIDYGQYAQYGLPYCVTEYANNGTTELRRSYTDYNLSQQYLDRHIIGLVSAVHIIDPAQSFPFVNKTDYVYDNAGIDPQATAATQHDQSFNSSFLARGNVTAVSRWDTTGWGTINDPSKALTTTITYNAAGSVLTSTDPSGHRNSISYGDSFSDGNNGRGTFAYPTTVTDADSNTSFSQYNYDFGARTRVQNPLGAVQTVSYDEAARIQRVTIANTGAYTRYDYGPNYAVQNSSINNVADDAFMVSVFDGVGRVFVTFGTNPNSDGLYKEQVTWHDVMGRVLKQSKPTEVDANWQPAGDDTAGFYYTTQTYDWKGRPLVTTNPDGWQSIISYTGCGCAGGEATTMTDEAGRSRRTTTDVLGRLVRTEELNWPDANGNRSVYSTANYAYNALDQLTSINHEGQQRSFGYDGYGRLQTRITPEQGATTYAYNADDTIHSVTDARGATATYDYYNDRRLVNSITYNSVSGVAATPNVTFGYDAVGNRTSMNDGLGSASYNFNSLSQMTSETRSFNGVGSYQLSYGYNLAGELTGMTNPWNVWVGYSYDNNGRLNRMHADGSMQNVTTYAYDIKYRAFGAVKSMSFGDHQSLSTSYDERMRPTSWNVSNVLGYNYNYFEHTERVSYAQSIYDSTLDRSYNYDQVGALQFARSGAEARATFGINGQPWGQMDGPYSHQYDYDQFGNMIYRHGWGGEVQGGAPYGGDTDKVYTYSNGKNQRDGFSYDAAGNLTHDELQSYGYFANNQQAWADMPGYGLLQYYDGDGLRGLKTENGVTNTFYLRSTVLGGAVVAEIDGSGNWTRGYVYQGSDLLAIQSGGQISWVHEDAITKSQRVTDVYGSVISSIELDPWGANTNRSSNFAFQPHTFGTYERDSNGGQDAMMRRYNSASNFFQPDPYNGSYNFGDPQSLNRYRYTRNDPVNNADPTGLMCIQYHYTNVATGDGFWTPWYCTPGINNHEMRHAGGNGEKAPKSQKPSPLQQGIIEARNALQNSKCQALFGNLSRYGFNSPTDLLNTYANNGLINVGSSYPLALPGGGNTNKRFSSADTGAITTTATGFYPNASGGRISANVITVNSNGFYFSGRIASGQFVDTVRGGGFEGLNLTQIRGAVLIHELLHAIGAIPSDDPNVLKDNGAQSRKNAELVRKNCF